MSEIQDAAQIIKVSFEGAEIILKMGNTGWQFVNVYEKLPERVHREWMEWLFK